MAVTQRPHTPPPHHPPAQLHRSPPLARSVSSSLLSLLHTLLPQLLHLSRRQRLSVRSPFNPVLSAGRLHALFPSLRLLLPLSSPLSFHPSITAIHSKKGVWVARETAAHAALTVSFIRCFSEAEKKKEIDFHSIITSKAPPPCFSFFIYTRSKMCTRYATTGTKIFRGEEEVGLSSSLSTFFLPAWNQHRRAPIHHSQIQD